MAKKDTYLALLRRGIDDTTANQLADAGLKIGCLLYTSPSPRDRG